MWQYLMKVRYLNCFFAAVFLCLRRILLLFNLFLIVFTQNCSDFLCRTDEQEYLWIAHVIITGIPMIKSYYKNFILSMQSSVNSLKHKLDSFNTNLHSQKRKLDFFDTNLNSLKRKLDSFKETLNLEFHKTRIWINYTKTQQPLLSWSLK